jgi:hypothetical protein
MARWLQPSFFDSEIADEPSQRLRIDRTGLPSALDRDGLNSARLHGSRAPAEGRPQHQMRGAPCVIPFSSPGVSAVSLLVSRFEDPCNGKDFDIRQIASDLPVETPSLSAIRTRSTKDLACILREAWLRWTFTVSSLNSS